MFKTSRRAIGPLAVAGALALGAVPVLANTSGQSVAPHGAVVALMGTPHLFIADGQGTLHWAGDTRALAGHFINWADRREVSLEALRSFRIGDPRLSAGLLKIGDPIYLVKWETNEAKPTLYHIQTIQDVELFGINATNYGTFVMDTAAWERRFAMSVDTLARATLQSAVLPTATPAPAATATPVPTLTAKLTEVKRNTENEFRTVVKLTGGVPGTKVTVSMDGQAYQCTVSCNVTDTTAPVRSSQEHAGTFDTNREIFYQTNHLPYESMTYTFMDAFGNKVVLDLGNDLERGLSVGDSKSY